MRLIISKRALPTYMMNEIASRNFFFTSTLAQYLELIWVRRSNRRSPYHFINSNLNKILQLSERESSRVLSVVVDLAKCRNIFHLTTRLSSRQHARIKEMECYGLRCRLAIPLLIQYFRVGVFPFSLSCAKQCKFLCL